VELEGKIAVVTGAAQGNGRAIAELLAREGAQVVLGDIDEPTLAEAVGAIEAAGGRATGVRCDVTDAADVDALIAAAEDLGGPHVVVAQAGGLFGATIEGTTPEVWDRIMAIDVKGTFLTVRAALPRMRRLGGGAIVTMSGTFAHWAEHGVAAHCAAKGAILSFTRAAAIEAAPDGIRVNAIAPGYVATPMVESFYAEAADGAELRARVERWHALGRIATPQEIAEMALFLASDRSSFCTGQTYVVDGGMIAGVNTREAPLERGV